MSAAHQVRLGFSFRRLAGMVGALALTSVAFAAPAFADFREIRVTFTNNSDSPLVYDGSERPHGQWNQEPPRRIEVDQVVTISSSNSDGSVNTGTEWSVRYKLELTGQSFVLHYSNPAEGSDTFDDHDAPIGYSLASGGEIENRTVRFGCDSTVCDGIPDDWKRNGVTVNNQFVDLPAMGVSLDRPTVLVQLDWMDDNAGRSLKLRQSALDKVITAYDQAPVTYHGATRPGITLLIDQGRDSTLRPGGPTWGDLSRADKIPWSKYLLTGNRTAGYQQDNFYTLLKNRFVPTGRLPIFHYGVAADVISQDMSVTPAVDDNTSGLTVNSLLGFMVTLGNWDGKKNGTENDQAGTFMHEFGHTLGLDHSGGEGNGDGVNFKPNYPSVMNYAWQTVGVFRDGTQSFDYSRAPMPDVDEATLTQAGGVDLGANPLKYGTTNSCATTDAKGVVTRTTTNTQAGLAPLDLDCDGTSGNDPAGSTGGYDANGDGAVTVLKGGWDDWRKLRFKTGGVGYGSAVDQLTIPSSGVSQPNQHELTLEEAEHIRVLPLVTSLTYTGSTTGDYHDSTRVSATLSSDDDGPLAGKSVVFRLGTSATDTCTATTDTSGSAACDIVPTQAPGELPLTASFAGDNVYKPADTSATFTETREETSLSLGGTNVILAGSGAATLSATLLEDGTVPPNPSGQTVTFTLGSQTCTGTADTTGTATCSIANVSSAALGAKSVTAGFAGDTYYEPSAATKDVIVFAFPTSGAFVVGRTSGNVTFWGPQWNTANGGGFPNSFKGFADTVTSLPTTSPATTCGTVYVARNGNSGSAPSTVPSYMGTLVPTSVVRNGGDVVGYWARIVVVKTNAGYGPAVGHAGTGTVVATFC